MARLNINISDALYRKLKQAIAERWGGKKGDLTKAVEQALELWLAKKP
jgi:hypothetical protein